MFAAKHALYVPQLNYLLCPDLLYHDLVLNGKDCEVARVDNENEKDHSVASWPIYPLIDSCFHVCVCE